MKDGFIEFMSQSLASGTISTYRGKIGQCDELLWKYQLIPLGESLFDIDLPQKVDEYFEQLKKIEEFNEKDTISHWQYSAAIKKYIEYLVYMRKPTEILELERNLNIKLKETSFYGITINPKSYYLKDKKTLGLNLVDCNISKINLSNFRDLESLSLFGNNISSLKDIIGLEQQINLNFLQLAENNITEIDEIRLEKLEILYLHNNGLQKITNLSGFPNLKRLGLHNNHISFIDFDGINKLETLSIENNNIKDEETIKKIISQNCLKELTINNNPIFHDVGLILEDSENHLLIIKNYLSTLEGVISEIDLPVKVMLLGNHQCGKSTFLKYYTSEPNELPSSTNSTHILDIVRYHNQPMADAPYIIFYDFGGQDYYHGLYQAFFTADSINILFWCKETNKNQIRKTDTYTRDFSREYWLNQVQYALKKRKDIQNSKEPIILVQTHADSEKTQRENFRGDANKYNIVNELFLSLDKDSVQNDNYFRISLEYLQETLNHEVKVKQRIEKKPDYYSDFLHYILRSESADAILVEDLLPYYGRKALAHETKEDIKSYLKSDLQQLALKGIVLYYEDKKLNEFVWLSPSFTISKIHEEILSKEKVNKGIIPEKEFEQLCKDDNLKHLLINEKVIFLDKSINSYIIPNYLKLSSQDEYYDLIEFGFDSPNISLKFIDFIPFGLINQMICFFGRNPDKKHYWRDRLIFTFEQKYKILIKLDFENLAIDISYLNLSQNIKNKDIEKFLIFHIIDFYWGKEPKYTKRGIMLVNNDPDNDKKRQKHIEDGYKEYLKEENINIPEDLFISLDQKNYVNYKELWGINSQYIQSYTLLESTTLSKTLPSSRFKHLVNNRNLRTMKKIFISYSRKDVDYKNELKNHLNMLRFFDIADNWSCEEITIGKWDEQIQGELESSDLIVFMLSANFFSSQYILDKEVKKGIELAANNPDKKIVSVIVSDFAGLDKFRSVINEEDLNDTQNAVLALGDWQFLAYSNVINSVTENREEKITPLKRHPHPEQALSQITEKILEVLK